MNTTTTTPDDDGEDLRGFAQIPRWLQRRESTSRNAKLVYLALSSRADKYGQSWPSHATLAKEASCSVSSVKVALEELKALKVVSWTKRGKEGRGQTSNVYKIEVALPVDNSTNPVASEQLPASNEGGPVASTRLGGSQPLATNESQVNETGLNTGSGHSAFGSAPVDKSKAFDGPNSNPTPASVPAHPSAIDWARVLNRVDQVFASVGPEDLEQLGIDIITKAKSRVLSPTAYVIKSLTGPDRFEWSQHVLGIEARRLSNDGRDF